MYGKCIIQSPNVLKKIDCIICYLLTVLMVVIIDKEADIASVTYVALSKPAAKPQVCRILTSRHGLSLNFQQISLIFLKKYHMRIPS